MENKKPKLTIVTRRESNSNLESPEITKIKPGVYTTPGTRRMDKLTTPDQCQLPPGINFLRFVGGDILEYLLEESTEAKQFVALSPEYLIKTAQGNQLVIQRIRHLLRETRMGNKVLKWLNRTKGKQTLDEFQAALHDQAKLKDAELKKEIHDMIEAMRHSGYIVKSNGELIEIAQIRKLEEGEWVMEGG